MDNLTDQKFRLNLNIKLYCTLNKPNCKEKLLKKFKDIKNNKKVLYNVDDNRSYQKGIIKIKNINTMDYELSRNRNISISDDSPRYSDSE